MNAVRAEWAARVVAEYRSASRAAQLLPLGIALGWSRGLLDTLGRIVHDELDHATLSHAVLVAAGGQGRPLLDARALLPEPVTDPVAEAVRRVLHDFLLGEGFAVPLFRSMGRGASEPVAVAALERIVRDEVVHHRFGLDAFDALLALDAGGVRAVASASLPASWAAFRAAYTVDGPDLAAHEVRWGLLHPSVYRTRHAAAERRLRALLAARGVG